MVRIRFPFPTSRNDELRGGSGWPRIEKSLQKMAGFINSGNDAITAAVEAAEAAQDAAETAASQAMSGTPDGYSDVLASIADEFSTDKSYTAGAYVWHNSKLYMFTADHAAGAWSGSDAAEAVISSEITGINSIIDDSKMIGVYPIVINFIQGNINASGANSGSSYNIRTNDYYPVDDDVIFTFDKLTYSSSIYCAVYGYDDNNTFISGSMVNYSAAGSYVYKLITGVKKIRFLISRAAGDTTTIITPSDGAKMITAAYKKVIDIADINQPISLDWEAGKISSSGTNTSSTSTTHIRTGYKYFVPKSILYITPPVGKSFELHKYVGDTYEKIGTYSTNMSFSIAADCYIRLVMFNIAGGDISLSDGHNLKVSYSVSRQSGYDKLIDYNVNDYASISMFDTIGVIGDSWSAGSIYASDGTSIRTDFDCSWPSLMAKSNGITAVSYSAGGLSSKTWLTNPAGLTTLLADDPKSCYIIALGINDNTQIAAGTLTLGTIADVHTDDYTDNPDTFYGDYGKIIGNIKEHSPKSIIICLSVFRQGERNMDAHIKAIADKYNIPFIQLTDDEYFQSGYFNRAIYGGHMGVFGYSGVAKAVQRLIQKDIAVHQQLYAAYDGSLT